MVLELLLQYQGAVAEVVGGELADPSGGALHQIGEAHVEFQKSVVCLRR